MKKLKLLLLVLFSCTVLHAQQRTVTGRVTDLETKPLPGVNVVVEGTSLGTVTDIDGKYTIQMGGGQDILVFSYVGYISQNVDVGNRSVVDVTLQQDLTALEEIVVVGYGTQKKVNMTGSVEELGGATVTKQPVFQVSQALTGTMPGVTVIQNSGQPGQDVGTIRIRGLGSLGSGSKNEPLVLIDGVQGDINDIDGGDIENISVLKDAAASAIYGSRAANGVILITTKRASEGRMIVSYNTYLGWQTPTDKPKYLGALDFLENDGESTEAFIDEYRANIGDPDRYPDTDWVDRLFTESGFMQYHQVAARGGTEALKLSASVSYQDQNGNIPNFNFKRYNARFNSDIKVSDKINVNFDLNFNKSKNTSSSAGLWLITEQAFRIPPIYIAQHSDGQWGFAWGGRNPIAHANDNGLNVVNDNYFRGILRVNYEPIKGLNLSLMYSPEYQDVYGKNFTKTFEVVTDWDLQTTATVPDRSSLQQTNTRSFTDNVNVLASYTKNFNEKHDFTILGGYEMIKFDWEQFGASRDQFILQKYQVLNAGSEENDQNFGSATHNSLVSFFGRLNYAFMNRYLFEANIRRDASSRFAPENRESVFPSFSVGWRVAEEPFFQSVGLFSDLKLRASWGQLGNQQIGSDFPYVSSISIGSNNYVFDNSVFTGATQNVLANPDIQWETTETTNFGIDAGLLDNRLTFTFEYYIRKTNDILLQIPIPLNVGLSPSTQNAASVENRGWDFSAGWQDQIGEFSYNIGVIASDFTNEVTDLAGVGPIISGSSIIEVGQPINSIYGYESQSMFQSEAEINEAPSQFGSLIPGNIRYVDQNNDGLINPDDREIIGNPFPQMSYGINLSAEFRGFDLSLQFQGVGKRDVLLGGDAVWALYNAGKIQEWHMEESWTPERPNAKFPIVAPTSSGSNDIQTSSTWVFDASYFRLRNLNFGYSLPSSLFDDFFISHVRAYFSGQNLFTLKKLPEGLDPLVPNGTSGGFYPIVSTYTFGVEVRF
jgi:TonB-linked SusC/RagA family outer membrane protein